MNGYTKLAAGLAAVVIVAVAGWSLLPKTPSVGDSSPSPSPTTTPVASPSVTPIPTPRALSLRPIAGNPLVWQVTVPPGWTDGGSNWFLYPVSVGGPAGNASGKPNGLAVAFVNVPEVFVDSCNFESMSETSSVAELVAAIRAKDDWVSSAPIDVTISGFAGQRLDVALPADLSVCGSDNYLVFGEPGTGNGFYAQGPSQLLRVWIIDVDGRIVLLARESFAGTPPKELAEAQPIIESSVITP